MTKEEIINIEKECLILRDEINLIEKIMQELNTERKRLQKTNKKIFAKLVSLEKYSIEKIGE